MDEKVTKSRGLRDGLVGTPAPTSDEKNCVGRTKCSLEFCVSYAKGCSHIGVTCARQTPEICVSRAKSCSTGPLVYTLAALQLPTTCHYLR